VKVYQLVKVALILIFDATVAAVQWMREVQTPFIFCIKGSIVLLLVDLWHSLAYRYTAVCGAQGNKL
jgi:hypothetical protein